MTLDSFAYVLVTIGLTGSAAMLAGGVLRSQWLALLGLALAAVFVSGLFWLAGRG